MFQEEMFSAGVFRGATFLGSGCYAAVYSLPDTGWVVKYGDIDGTLNYLEWCKYMQSIGKGMKGMPEIDVLIRTGADRYIVTMPQYRSAEDDFDVHHVEEQAAEHYPYLICLIEAFRAYVEHRLLEDPDVFTRDVHHGNVMWSKSGELILTDPAACAYKVMPTVELH